jgi:hypothetical protein
MVRIHAALALVFLVSGCGGTVHSSAILHIECNRHGGKTNQKLQLFEGGYTFVTSSSYPSHNRGAGRLSAAEWEEVCARFQQVLDATDLREHGAHGSVSLTMHVFFADGRYKYVGVPTSLVFGDGRFSFIEDYYNEFFRQRPRRAAAGKK